MSSILQGTLASEERLRWLSETLTVDGSVTIAAAAEALRVSDMTIRRDLAELEDRGTARRVRGGARALGPQSFAERRQRAGRAKARIAAKLAELVPAQGVVAFDASSTIMRLASGMDAARDLTVLTNGPDTFAALQGLPGVTADAHRRPPRAPHRQPRRPARLSVRRAVHGADALRLGRGGRRASAVRWRRRSRRPR